MKEQVQEIRIGELHPFRKHPFHVKDDESMEALCDSIQEYGVLSPLLARPTGEGYEIVSGHRRRAAALKLGLKKLSYLIKLEQAELWDIVQAEDCTPSLSQAVRMKKLSQKGELNPERIYEIMSEEKANQKERVRIMLPQLMEQRGVTEELKASDPMRWVQEMNAIRATIEEIIRSELICGEDVT